MAILPGARTDPGLVLVQTVDDPPTSIKRGVRRIAVAASISRLRIRCWKISLSRSSMIGRVL
jgi:hypothetical protein